MTETTLSSELWAQLTAALGLPADADAETVVAAVEDAVANPEPDPARAAQVAAAAGLTTVDPESLAALQRDAERGRELAAAESKRIAAGAVDAAIRSGKITPARREHWLTLVAADPAMSRTLAAMPDNMIGIVEIGHAQDPDGVVTETAPWFR